MLSVKQNIGALDRRITFQQAVTTTDASNQRKTTGWENIGTTPTVCASVSEKTGNEINQADQLVGVQTKEFVIRYREDLNIQMTVVYNSVRYDIQSIVEVGRHRYLVISTESGGQYVGTTELEDIGAFADAPFSSAFA